MRLPYQVVVLLALTVTEPESRALVQASPLAAPIAQPGLWDWITDKAQYVYDTASSIVSTGKELASEVPDEVAAQLLNKYDQYTNLNMANNPSWMAGYKDELPISQLSIPGTHDSMTFVSRVTPVGQCQSWDLATQFKGGIRFLDIRARHVNNQYEIFHGVVPTFMGMTHVLREIARFLDAHPSETIIFRHKDENSAMSCSRTYAQTYEWYRYSKPETKDIYAKYAWAPKDPENPEIPTLGALRGKFLVLMDFDDWPRNGGLRYENNEQMAIQDSYSVWNNNIGHKWKEIVRSLDDARQDTEKTKLHLCYLSAASEEVWPRPLAIGSKDFTGLNVLTNSQLKAYESTGDMTPVGIVIMDFPGMDITNRIINLAPQESRNNLGKMFERMQRMFRA